MKIILASSSPRRKEILEKIGLKFIIKESGFEEITKLKNPISIVKFLASEKAKTVGYKYPKDLVIAADTIVEINKKILGKPKSNTEAKQMLEELSGKTHRVYTALSVIKNKKIITKVSTTDVKFKKISQTDIDAYIKTGDPFDKAGGYGIQGKAGIFIEEIKGEYFNILGLPVCLLTEILSQFNISIAKYWD